MPPPAARHSAQNPVTRLPAHLEVGALLRAVAAAGGFASVLHKGERDAGTILVVVNEKAANARAYEQMPDREGGRAWRRTMAEDTENKKQFQEWLDRRAARDPDLWIVELDIAQGERFIGLTPPPA